MHFRPCASVGCRYGQYGCWQSLSSTIFFHQTPLLSDWRTIHSHGFLRGHDGTTERVRGSHLQMSWIPLDNRSQIFILKFDRVMIDLISTISSRISSTPFYAQDILQTGSCQDSASCKSKSEPHRIKHGVSGTAIQYLPLWALPPSQTIYPSAEDLRPWWRKLNWGVAGTKKAIKRAEWVFRETPEIKRILYYDCLTPKSSSIW